MDSPYRLLFCLVICLILVAFGCAAAERMTAVATDAAEKGGIITGAHDESIRTSTRAVSRSLEEFTPEQECYIGRTVGAAILSGYSVLDDPQANGYVNMVGQALVAASEMPELSAGYHFLILDSDEINAFATHGGHVLVTRGTIGCCRSEDELAAVLAHEIGHIQLRHGMKAIGRARLTEALTIIAEEGVKSFGPGQAEQLTGVFVGVVSDITATLVNRGYSRTFEYQAWRRWKSSDGPVITPGRLWICSLSWSAGLNLADPILPVPTRRRKTGSPT